MIRKIVEGLQGRKRVLNDTPQLQEIIELLQKQNPDIRGTVYFNGVNEYLLTNAHPQAMTHHVQENFGISGGGEYIKIRHQTFKGKKDEKHYIDLAMGIRYSTYTELLHRGKQMIYEAPFRKTTIDFLVTE